MKAFQKLQSKVIPLPMKEVDTDLIIPAQYLTSVSKEGYGENLFRRLRDSDPNFPLNLERYQGAEILIADDNFGCGSSREHAVWAILGVGIKVVICKSFADIFTSNSAKNGLLLIVLKEEEVDDLLDLASKGELQLTVDLENQKVETQFGQTYSFDYDSFRKHCLLNGLDDIDYILSAKQEVEAFRKTQDANRFYSTHQAVAK